MKGKEIEYLLVVQYFHPDTASTGQLMTDLAVGLQKRGLNMTVLTTQPNYHSGDLNRQPHREEFEGVDVMRIRAPQVRQSSLLRRAFNWIVYTCWMSVVLLLSRSNHDRHVIFVSNPPFFPLVAGAVCVLRRWEYTYIVYDLWPEKGVEFGFYSERGIVDRIWSALQKQIFSYAKTIVTLGPKMKEGISDYSEDEALRNKMEIIDNWADAKYIEPRKKSDNFFSKEHGLIDKFSLLYSGNIGFFHDLETVIESAANFDSGELKVLIIGEGDNKKNIQKKAQTLGVAGETVEFLPYQPKENLPYSLTSADVSIVTVQKGFEGTCVSSKLYTALAAGQPVLVVAQPDSDEARIVQSYDAGKTVEPENSTKLAEEIQDWMQNPELVDRQGTNAREAFENQFTKEKSIDAYHEVLKHKENL